MPDNTFVDIILPFPLNRLFTYSVPEEMIDTIVEGGRVIVPFGARRYYTGIVAAIHTNKPKEYETKEIVAAIDNIPAVNEIQLQFWKWISAYYMCSLGEVMKAALPSGLKLESETAVSCNNDFEDVNSLLDSELLIFEFIQSKHEVLIKDISIQHLKRNLLLTIKSLAEKNAIFIHESISDKYTPKTETYVRFSPSAAEENYLQNLLDSLKRAPKQAELVENYIHLSGAFENTNLVEVKKSSLLEMASSGANTLKSLIEKGVFEVYKKELNRLFEYNTQTSEPFSLSPAQDKALITIKEEFETKDVVLLHGITSSGKTEVYFHLIDECIRQNKQVLYILPEIAITAQIINRLRTHFGNNVCVYHSKFSDNERIEIWNRLHTANKDKFQIVLGVRSSIFLPFSNLGLIIVDEEHETSFKQYDPAPRYHARDAAIVLAGMHKAKVLLGSATPSIESYFNATQGRYGLVNLNERFLNIKLPEIHIVNMQIARKKGHVNSHFSHQLLAGIDNCLNTKKQIILFQNRRGFAPFLECPECSWTPKCKHCDVTLTYHKFQNQLVCHYCSYTLKVPNKCNDCNSTGIKTMGFGTEKIEEELKLIFPEANIARMDLDATRNKHAHEEIIAAFENARIDILVGTQMVTKGLDFANVGLVGVLNADNMLNFPDFRAFERSFQLMVQVGGRAGRKNERGQVIIQTSSPGHPIIQNVIKNNFIEMYTSQLSDREVFKYPPFYRIIQLTIKHREESKCSQAASKLVSELRTRLGERVLGPDIPLIGRIQNLYLRHIIIKIERQASLSAIKQFITEKIENTISDFKPLQVSVDVDPI